MATRFSIQMDFDKAKRQADELDDIANGLDREANRSLTDTLNALGNDWRGENADQYIRKGFTLKEEINGTAKSLHQAASTIRTIAKRIYDVEMENLRIAEERQRAEEQRAAEEAHARAYSGGGGGGGGGRGW